MIEFLRSLPKTKDHKTDGSNVASLASNILESKIFWGSSDITRHLDCSAKQAADYLDNIINGARYQVDVLSSPRRIKVIAINKQVKATKIKPDILTLATAIKESGNFWSRKDIKQFLIDNDITDLSGNYPSQIAHGFYLKLIKNKHLTVETSNSSAMLRVIHIQTGGNAEC